MTDVLEIVSYGTAVLPTAMIRLLSKLFFFILDLSSQTIDVS